MKANNNQKMRKALEQINRIVWDKRRHTKEETEAHRLATEALSAPARNCDIGTAEEQDKRFTEFCDKSDGCVYCPFRHKKDIGCSFLWSQMPYEEGGAG